MHAFKISTHMILISQVSINLGNVTSSKMHIYRFSGSGGSRDLNIGVRASPKIGSPSSPPSPASKSFFISEDDKGFHSVSLWVGELMGGSGSSLSSGDSPKSIEFLIALNKFSLKMILFFSPHGTFSSSAPSEVGALLRSGVGLP